jgi:signal peptidase I
MFILFSGAAIFMLSYFGYINTVKPYVVQSGSMEPGIPTGSIILSLPSDLYQPGDVITFAADGDSKMLVTHRLNFKVFENGNTKYITSGDANEDFDRWEVTKENIVGKVVMTIPYAGYAIDFAKTPQGFIALVVIPATVVIYEELKNLLKELAKVSSAVVLFFRKRKDNQPNPEATDNKTFTYNKLFLFAPVVGILIFITAFSAAYLFDIEKSSGNVIGVSTDYGHTPTPTVTPTNSPTPSLTITPTPTGIQIESIQQVEQIDE